MNEKKSRLKQFFLRWIITTLAVLVTVVILRPHIDYRDTLDLFAASLILGILNAFIRPIMFTLAWWLILFSLGMFMLFINAFLLYAVHWLMGPAFTVESFWWALLGSLIISTVSVALSILTGTSNARITIRRGSPPPRGGGGGPVIDV